MDESKYLAPEDLRELETWAIAWYEEAVKAEFIGTSYHPDTATLGRLRGYFKAGLSPAEAAHACFGGKH
jgi:hypothetical protein